MTTRLLLAAFLSTLALGACQKDGGSGDAGAAGPLPEGIEALPSGSRLAPPERTANCYAAPTRIVFHTQAEWDGFWVDERRGCTSPPLPAIDWTKEMIVYASMGKRMSAQDRISIEGTGMRGDTLLVFIRRSMEQSGCAGRETLFPQSLVKIPAHAKNVKFSEEHRRIPCGGTQS